MSTIFDREQEPRADATIRVKRHGQGRAEQDGGYVKAELLEYHLGLQRRRKGYESGYAFVKAQPALLVPEDAAVYVLCGEGYLPSPYLRIEEKDLHAEDVQALVAWCNERKQRAFIVHACPLPHPAFATGNRVKVVRGAEQFLDLQGTVISVNNRQGQCRVQFDNGMRRLCQSLDLREIPRKRHKQRQGEAQ